MESNLSNYLGIEPAGSHGLHERGLDVEHERARPGAVCVVSVPVQCSAGAVPVQCSAGAVQCSASAVPVQCSAVQCSAVQCSVIQCRPHKVTYCTQPTSHVVLPHHITYLTHKYDDILQHHTKYLTHKPLQHHIEMPYLHTCGACVHFPSSYDSSVFL
jgi:hypothetical protein